MGTTTQANDYQRIAAEIASDTTPVGTDLNKALVLIISKLESIEQRLDRLEQNDTNASPIPPALQETLNNALAATTDTIDDTIARLAERGVDVDARLRASLSLMETLTAPSTLESMRRIVQRIESLEQLTDLASHASDAVATITDILDDEVARAREQGIQFDAALRNGLTAMIYLGQRVTTNELEALGTLLRSDVLHPAAVDIVGRLGCALVAAAEAPSGAVGPIKAISKLSGDDAKRSTAFVLEFARRFGATLGHRHKNPNTTLSSGRCES
ncbi:MAG: hypothetical protein KDA33_14060 [Phycisphaerales bacterium]|nr:hypothetical protein [Phycisphaerales bacterium]